MRRGDARLGKEIRRNRKLSGLTQEAVGREFGISPKSVGKWERGRRSPRRETLALRGRRVCSTRVRTAGPERRRNDRTRCLRS